MSEGESPKLGDMLQTAQRLQQEMRRVQEELAEQVVEGSAGGGIVVARVTGRQQLVGITIDKEIVDPGDIEMLQDLVVAAVNQGLSKATELAQQSLSQVAGGLAGKIPGLIP